MGQFEILEFLKRYEGVFFSSRQIWECVHPDKNIGSVMGCLRRLNRWNKNIVIKKYKNKYLYKYVGGS